LWNMWSFSSWRDSWDPSHGKSEPVLRLMLEGGCIAFNSYIIMCQLIYSTSLLVLYCCCMSQHLKTTPQKHVEWNLFKGHSILRVTCFLLTCS
jgi:hypothetical protein